MIIDAKNLIHRLDELKKNGYVFRGHADPAWLLQPKIFRPHEMQKIAEKFPVKADGISKWMKNEKIENILQRTVGNDQRQRTEIKKIFNLYIYIMQHNRQLHEFFTVEKNQQKISPVCLQGMMQRDIGFWIKEDSFVKIIERLLERWFTYRDLNDRIIKKPSPDNDLTGFDETFPQHYDISTAALDWSFNPAVAICFALEDEALIEVDSQTGLFMAKKTPLHSLSIFAYKQKEMIQDPEVFLIESNSGIDNERIKRQEGVFTYFREPCSFYVKHGRFPSLGEYEKRCFDLFRYDVKRDKVNLDYLENHLQELKIDKEYLLPEL